MNIKISSTESSEPGILSVINYCRSVISNNCNTPKELRMKFHTMQTLLNN